MTSTNACEQSTRKFSSKIEALLALLTFLLYKYFLSFQLRQSTVKGPHVLGGKPCRVVCVVPQVYYFLKVKVIMYCDYEFINPA